MSLKDVYCQQRAINILQKQYIADKLTHSYIFAGPRGVGKYKTALEFAKLLLCENPRTENDFADSCGRCHSCKMVEAESHPDFAHIYKELLPYTKNNKNKKNPIDLPIDVIREFVVERVSQRPAHSRARVFVIDEAEKLNASSQNCLLKVLEEPPEYCYLILLCTRAERLLPTTKSRCQILRFGPVDEEIIIRQLGEMGLGAEQGRYFARLAEGRLGEAINLARLQKAGADIFKDKKKIIDSMAGLSYPQTLDLAADFLEISKSLAKTWAKSTPDVSPKDIGRQASKTLIRVIIAAITDAVKLNISAEKQIVNQDQKEKIAMLGRRFSLSEGAEKIDQAYEVLRWVDASVNEKLIFEQLLLNLARSDRIQV